MPELPDAEIFRRRLARGGLRRRIRSVRAPDARLLDDVSESTLRRRLEDHSLETTRRHGKYVFARVSDGGGWLVLHFGMTGDLEVRTDGDAGPSRHDKLLLDLDDGRTIVFSDPRTFGRIAWTGHPADFVRERGLGPDPLRDDVGLHTFRERIGARRSPIKAVLMNQSVLAGIGNVYADEILFQAGVHPRARADALRPETLARVHAATRRVLETAIAARADPDAMPAHFLIPHRREGAACPKCGQRLRMVRIGGRGTYFCSRDQEAKA